MLLFFVIRVYCEKLGHMLKLLLHKFRPDPSVRLKDIAEKQFPTKLKPIEGWGALAHETAVTSSPFLGNGWTDCGEICCVVGGPLSMRFTRITYGAHCTLHENTGNC